MSFNAGAILTNKTPLEKSRSSLFVLAGLNEEAILHLGSLLKGPGGVQCYLETGISRMREKAEEYAKDLYPKTSAIPEGADTLARRILSDSLEGLIVDGGGKPVGFVEVGGDVLALLPLREDFDLKILCVIRDPRDVASAERLTASEESRELADAWVRHLKEINLANRKHPGLIEIVRYEDLDETGYAKTFDRVCRFLGVDVSSTPEPARIDTLKPLPTELLSIIEERASFFLTKLRYPLRSPSELEISLSS